MRTQTDKTRRSGLSLSWLLAMILAVSTLAQSKDALTNIQSVLNLPDDVLASKPAVQLQAVVTCVDKSYGMIFVQDDTGGIFLYETTPGADLNPGDLLALDGIVRRGLFFPMIGSAQVTVLGKTNLPLPRPISIGTLNSGSLVGDRVEVQGVVERQRKHGDHLFLHLTSGENHCTISVIHSSTNVPDLVDARLRVPGVAAATFNKQQELTGFQVMVQEIADLQVLGRPTQPAFDSPIRTARDLARPAVRGVGEHRVRVSGAITLHWPERLTVIQDSTGGILIEGGLPGSLKAGERVEAAGFLAHSFNGMRLRHAEGRRVENLAEVVPQPSTVAQATERNNQLVRLLARVVEWQRSTDGNVLVVLSSSNQVLSALLPAAGVSGLEASFPPGSIVSAIGVFRVVIQEGTKLPAISLLLRAPGDLRLVKMAPRSSTKWIWLASWVAISIFVTAAVVVGLLWSRHSRALTAAHIREKTAQSRFAEMEQQLRSSHRDRELIAQELHDNIIQSIYSVGLGLDEARRLAGKQPERLSERLAVAVESLNALIRDVRAFIGGLEPKGLEGHELKAALKSVLVASGEDQQARFSIRIDPAAARSLTTLQATEIFNIAKEAMTNSMRHSQAALTTVTLVSTRRGGTRLEIEDNGMGFDPSVRARDSMGLRHMQQRAHSIGATFNLSSKPGRGVRITVDISDRSVQNSPTAHDN